MQKEAMKYMAQQHSQSLSEHLGDPKTLSGETMRSSDLFSNIKMSFAFFILFMYAENFPGATRCVISQQTKRQKRWYKNQLTSIKPELKERCKM